MLGRLVLGAALLVGGVGALGQSAVGHPEWPGKGQLFVGTCYQPVDRTPEEIHRDIRLMKEAGFTMVRMGDLAWDSFEPEEGRFEFGWFDSILKEMHEAGIGVILDISGLPAPIWLHHRYPSVNLVNAQGDVVHPAERYMVNIGDPVYRAHVVAFAEVVTKHYAKNPALVAIGYDNEIGNGFMSYSAGDRARFIGWLKVRYGTVAKLNEAWATQRWSRRLGSFDEVEIPYGDGPGPPERYLDLHRYWSDVTVGVIEDLEKIRERNVPNLPAASNLWDTSGRKGFDYLSSYKKYVTYGSEGFYPGSPLDASLGVLLTKGDLETPTWFNEFVTGGPGYYGGPKGVLRMWAYVGLIDYGQTYLAWTFNTHRGGEEQALFGLLDHDGTPSWKYREFARIATEFKTLEKLGFPRNRKPEVAIAYSFESAIASNPPGNTNSAKNYFSVGYHQQVVSALEPLFDANIDVATINVGHDKLDYKLVVVPADYVMDAASADALRAYVAGGGTVVMTAMSAKVDEHSQWFDTAMPGRLSDVFGIRTEEFNRPSAMPEMMLDGKSVKASIGFYEVLELRGARAMASFTNTEERSPAITVNAYGKGKAIYVAVPSQGAVLGPLLDGLYGRLGIVVGPRTPAGVYARVVEGRTLYVNTTGEDKAIPVVGTKRGVVSGRTYVGEIRLGARDADLVE